MPNILSGGQILLWHTGHQLKIINGALCASVGSPLKWGQRLPCQPERVSVPSWDLSLSPLVIILCCVQAHFSTGRGASWKPARSGKHLRIPARAWSLLKGWLQGQGRSGRERKRALGRQRERMQMDREGEKEGKENSEGSCRYQTGASPVLTCLPPLPW